MFTFFFLVFSAIASLLPTSVSRSLAKCSLSQDMGKKKAKQK